jgi:hypothetical protein
MPRAKKSHADSGTSGVYGGASSSGGSGAAPAAAAAATTAAPGAGAAAAALSDEELEALLESAPLSSAKNRASCATLLGHLKRHRAHWVFGEPVDTVALGLHDYYDVIKQPMDLGTIGKKLRGGSYMMVMDMVRRRCRRVTALCRSVPLLPLARSPWRALFSPSCLHSPTRVRDSHTHSSTCCERSIRHHRHHHPGARHASGVGERVLVQRRGQRGARHGAGAARSGRGEGA